MGYSILVTPHALNEGHPHHDPKVNAALKEHEDKFGSYNDTPPGWREITEKDFAQSQFFQYNPEKTEFRQIYKAEVKSEAGGPLLNARLYFFHDGTGVAMMNDYWAGKLRYFAFGCKHEYRKVDGEEARKLGLHPSGPHDHAYCCDLCDHKMIVDSSD